MNFVMDVARVLLCIAALLGLLETGMRLAEVHYQASLYMPDAVRGYTLRPNSHGWDVEENANYVEINSAGMRDKERTVERPPHTLRIAVIGDSQAEARQVPLEKTFEAVMERRLAPCAPDGQNVEVLNFGVPGYSLGQEWLMLRDQVPKYKPQVVVLAMSMATAVTKNLRVLDSGDNHGTPVFDLVDGKLVPDGQTRARRPVSARALYWKNVSSDWMNGSELLLLLNEGRVHLREPIAELRRELRQLLHPGAAAVQAVSRDPDALPANWASSWPYLGPANPILKRAWDVTEAILLAMRDECAAHGQEFWIVTLDMSMQVHPDVPEREKLERQLGVSSLEVADERVAQFAEAHGIRHLMLVPVTADYAAKHHVALHGFPGQPFNYGHWNETGHRVAGERIARAMCESWTERR